MKFFIVLLTVLLFSACAIPMAENTAEDSAAAKTSLDASYASRLELTVTYDPFLRQTVMTASLDFGSGPIPITVFIDFYADSAWLPIVPHTHIGRVMLKNGQAVLNAVQRPGIYNAMAVWENAPGGRRCSKIVRYKVPRKYPPLGL